jgi:hypothetical protein
MTIRDEVEDAIKRSIRARGFYDHGQIADAAIAAVKAHLSKPDNVTEAMKHAYYDVEIMIWEHAFAAAIAAWEVEK